MVVDVPHGAPRPGSSGRGVEARSTGKVIGNRPDGLTRPAMISAMATAPAWPGYQACKMAFTESRQGMATGLPVSSTTTVFGLAAATAAISASCPHGRDRSGLRQPAHP